MLCTCVILRRRPSFLVAKHLFMEVNSKGYKFLSFLFALLSPYGYSVKHKRNPKHAEIFVFVALLLLTFPFPLTLQTFVDQLPDGLITHNLFFIFFVDFFHAISKFRSIHNKSIILSKLLIVAFSTVFSSLIIKFCN